LHEKGLKNEVPDLKMVGPEEIREIEPNCRVSLHKHYYFLLHDIYMYVHSDIQYIVFCNEKLYILSRSKQDKYWFVQCVLFILIWIFHDLNKYYITLSSVLNTTFFEDLDELLKHCIGESKSRTKHFQMKYL